MLSPEITRRVDEKPASARQLAHALLIRKSFEIVVAVQTTRFFRMPFSRRGSGSGGACPAWFLCVLPYSTVCERAASNQRDTDYPSK